MDCNNIFTPIEIDAIGEILNISLGASATAISTMLNTRVDITTPRVRIVTDEEFSFEELKPVIGVEITYISGLEGKNIMLLKRGDVKLIVELLMGVEIADDEFELDEMNLSAVCEVMNQMMGASATALSEFLNKTVNISTPVSFELHSEEEFKKKYFVQAQPMVVVNFVLSIDNKLKSEFVNVMSVDLAKKLLNVFLPPEYREDEDRGEFPRRIASGGNASGKYSSVTGYRHNASRVHSTGNCCSNTAGNRCTAFNGRTFGSKYVPSCGNTANSFRA